MHTKQLYCCNDQQLIDEQAAYLDALYEFNHTRPSERTKRNAMLSQMFAKIGKDCYIEPPMYANRGGKHVHFKDGVYANFNLTLVDDTHIYVGNRVLFGPNVPIVAGTHPIYPEIRSKQAHYNMSVHIDDNVWIGANSVVLPGVHIGKNSVIGAGSVVTKDIPENVVAVGSPCHILRAIDKDDEVYYYKQYRVDIE